MKPAAWSPTQIVAGKSRLLWRTLFAITPSGTVINIYNFCAQDQACCPDGDSPLAGLVRDSNGNFYGATVLSGSSACPPGCGVVFSLSVGLRPFVKPQPSCGKVGDTVDMVGIWPPRPASLSKGRGSI